MIFTPNLQKARLVRRYKRFLADVILPDGQEITVHCPNTGSMKNCVVEGSDCWLLYSDNPKRKYAYTWQLATTPTGHIACVNTHVANKVIGEALAQGVIPELAGYADVRPEVKYGEGSRVDFLLSGDSLPACFVEVKSVTLLDDGQGCFPDAVSTRGQKHLRELMAVAAQGQRAVLLFCVLHSGIDSVSAAAHIDPVYAQLMSDAIASGVEVIAYGASISPSEITITKKLKVNA
ncbi:DNA/RNA nuclease SfsA [Marinagarivorans cellulosilyticus]|uniref:Sugar fermentation stimulation protein homolog n=1 Tax=Marinagarivorans cellulosilyticus TaxID=2721545 RepID=A0AAN2BJG7_9GAMM|nr:DNA/RNA nuclease SfsA [Marinagarivorans cellulosilyticus]BCD96901.1 sugar fermentation stimulation protein A [Marinagarivorans cellulosilyticus]